MKYKVWILTKNAVSVASKSKKWNDAAWLNKYCRAWLLIDVDNGIGEENIVGEKLRKAGVKDGETVVLCKLLLALPGRLMKAHVMTLWEGEKGGELSEKDSERVEEIRSIDPYIL